MAKPRILAVHVFVASLLQTASALPDSQGACERDSDPSQCQAKVLSKQPGVAMLQTGLRQSRIREDRVDQKSAAKRTSKPGVAMLQTKVMQSRIQDVELKFADVKNVNFPVGYLDGVAEQKADLMYPTSWAAPEAGWPAMILVHGKSMHKGNMYHLAQRFMKLPPGRLTMCPTFNSAKRRHFDIKAAVEFLVSGAGASDYNVDPAKVALYGYSTGGAIVTDLILRDRWIFKNLQAAVVVSGTFSYHDEEAHQHIPPLLLFHCEDDPTMQFNHTKDLYNALYAFGEAVTLQMEVCPSNLGHNPAGDKEWFVPIVDGFIKKQPPAQGVSLAQALAPPNAC